MDHPLTISLTHLLSDDERHMSTVALMLLNMAALRSCLDMLGLIQLSHPETARTDDRITFNVIVGTYPEVAA